ncbi:MAG TPA: cupin domain-containing protein [Burkholderiales bacterium]|nr:cupin domain-containing protein [Burkholderiales bacterium]
MTLPAGVSIKHHFMYAKENIISAGMKVPQHRHKYDHYSMLVKGSAGVQVDGNTVLYTAPALILIEAGKEHMVTAITGVEWWCLHETDERDVAKIDAAVVEDGVELS